MEAKKTAIYDCHVKLGGNMVEYAGWALPADFIGLSEEHKAVRENVGIFDVSHMGEVFIVGKDTIPFCLYLLSNDIRKAKDGDCQYSILLNEKGGVVDDLIACKFNDEKVMLVVNGANCAKDVEWIKAHVGSYDVQILDESSKYSEIAVQGPKSEELLQKLVDINLAELGYYTFKDKVKFGEYEVLVSRTGYTGEIGFEIYANWDDGDDIWTKLVEAGAQPCGLGCRDTLRFEASMPLYGNEMGEDMSPLEAGLKFAIDLNREEDFIGRKAIEDYRAKGLVRKIAGLELKGKGIPRQGYRVLKDGKDIGAITTGYLSPTLGTPIANVIIDVDEAVIGNKVDVQVRKKIVPAEIISRKFLQNK